MSDKTTTNIEVNAGLGAALLGLLKKPMVLGVLALMGWTWAGQQWWEREDVIKARLEKANVKAKKRIAKENSKISDRARNRLAGDDRQALVRKAGQRRANGILDRYQGKTDAVIPSDVHGAIQEVR